MIAHMVAYHYESTARYTTSTCMRLKMQEALSRRGLQPHIFERADEAHAAIRAKKPEVHPMVALMRGKA